jgi:hypothetical protein
LKSDPECFYTQVEFLVFPNQEQAQEPEGQETRVFCYSTPFITYQVTFNGRELVARAGMGDWSTRFTPRQVAIVEFYNLKVVTTAKPLYGDFDKNLNPPLTTKNELHSNVRRLDAHKS